MKSKKPQLTTLERFKNARRDYQAEKYGSIEEAAKVHKISPATYYNYAKFPEHRLVERKAESASSTQTDVDKVLQDSMRQLKSMISNDNSTIKQIKDQVQSLQSKIIELVLAK